MAALLQVDGEVSTARSLSLEDLASIDAIYQVQDLSRIDPKRKGDAVKLAGLLALVQPKPSANYLTLHASADNFHASIPLDAVREKALVIYRMNGESLPVSSGGPVRFFIPDFAACHTAEIDECANVKFVDRIELTAGRGFDNRPQDEKEHAALHKHS